MTNYYPTVNVDPPAESCDHARFTFYRSTSYSSAYFECDWCGEYTHEWTDESERDEDYVTSNWKEPIWVTNVHEDELCNHGLSLWLCADPINHYPRDGAY